jgi:hypothetical protein
MVFDISVQSLLKAIGHDGSEIWWPFLPEPNCRRTFHIQEMIDFSWKYGYNVTPFEALPMSIGRADAEPVNVPLNPTRLIPIMANQEGVLTGVTLLGQAHAIAWDGLSCYDPDARICTIEDFKIDTFWAISKR